MPVAPILIVNDNDVPVGTASISDAEEHGLIHRIVRVMVEDAAGNVLLQKRSPAVVVYPNCWDTSASGHVDVGESYEQAAARELQEELGLAVPLREIGYYYQVNDSYQNRDMRRFVKTYRAVVPDDTPLALQAEEVTGTRWFAPPEIRRLIAEHPDQVADGLTEVFGRHYM